jgi:hypothetical protein
MVSGLGHLGWPALSKTDGEQVLKIVRGRSESPRDAEILGEAAISVQWIKRKTAATQSPGQRREELILAAKTIEAAIKSIEKLPEATQREIDPEALLFRRTIKMTRLDGGDGYDEHELQQGTLNQLHDRIDALAKKITVKRSGGKKDWPRRRAHRGCKKACRRRLRASHADHIQQQSTDIDRHRSLPQTYCAAVQTRDRWKSRRCGGSVQSAATCGGLGVAHD